jgi:hypothetical protein
MITDPATADELAALLGISRSAVNAACRDGHLVRAGKRYDVNAIRRIRRTSSGPCSRAMTAAAI